MNETVSPNRSCPKCGAPLAAGTVEGLCPACLLALNLASQTHLTGETGAPAAKAAPPPAPDAIARFFPQLEILECLGRGGMGVVYKARQPRLNRLIALKILAPEREKDPAFAGRFEKEAQALARLNHPNIVTVHDFGETGGLYYLLMEYVDGVTLRQLLANSRVSPREALAIVPQICDALQFAHDLGIIHRDIKPENILMDRRGRVKVADFGLAKLTGVADAGTPGAGAAGLAESATEAGKVLGTPNYMAPEQASHPASVDHRADIYALGVVFYQMLTGELPGRALQPPSQKAALDKRLDDVVLRALEKKPEDRYQRAGELKTQVETIAGGPPPRPVPVLGWRDKWAWDTSYASLFLLIALLVPSLLILPLVLFVKVPFFVFIIVQCALLLWPAVYGMVGARVRRMKAALPGTAGEVAEALVFRRPVQSPALAVLHADRLELVRLVGESITIAFKDIASMSETALFNGRRLFFKRGFIFDLTNGQRVGVAVPEPFGRRWRAPLSRGALPELPPAETGAKPAATENLVLASAALGCAGMAGLLGWVAFAWMWSGHEPPQTLVWAIPVAALVGLVLGLRARQTSLGKSALVVASLNIAIWLIVAAFCPPLQKPVRAGESSSSTLRSGATDQSNPDVLRIQLAQAQNELKSLTDSYHAGIATQSDVDAAAGKVEILQAELTGDNVAVAQARLNVARRTMQNAELLGKLGIVTLEEATNAATEVRIREVELKAAQDAKGKSRN